MKLSSLIKNELVTGLLLLAPLVGAAWLVVKVVTAVDGLFPAAWRPSFRGTPVPGLGLVTVVAVALAVGLAAHNFVGRRLVGLVDGAVQRIPVFGSTYGVLKQVLEAVFSSGSGSFKQAVLVEYPHAGSWAIGFVTQEQTSHAIASVVGDDVVSVYVPTTPNPTSGFFLVVERARVRELPMPVEQAFKLLLTMGIADSDPEAIVRTGKWTRELKEGRKSTQHATEQR